MHIVESLVNGESKVKKQNEILFPIPFSAQYKNSFFVFVNLFHLHRNISALHEHFY